MAKDHAMAIPTNWLKIWCQFPSISPEGKTFPVLFLKMGLIALDANIPVRIAPIVPPAP